MAVHLTEQLGLTTDRSYGAAPRLALRTPLLGWLAAMVVCILAYLAFAVPGNWFPAAAVKTWSPRELSVVKGAGEIVDGALRVGRTDGEGQALVVATGEFRARDFAAIEWDVAGATALTDFRLVWRSDYAPQKLIAIPIRVDSNRLLPVDVTNQPDWLGRITFLGLLARGPLPEPLRVRAVSAKPMGALGVLGDRVREWMTFERWTGTSINVVSGGGDTQLLPLPLLLAGATVLTGIVVWIVLRIRRRPGAAELAGWLAAMFVASWFVLDARWMWNLARQSRETVALYGNKDWREKHLVGEDAPLFAFIEKVRASLPAQPARVIVAADENYFRNRAAYHLFPHRVQYDPLGNVLPGPAQLRPGDWMVVYQRRGVAYDPKAGLLRWDGGAPVKAQLKLVENGSALFLIQ